MRASNVRIDGQIAFVALTKGYETVIDACDIPAILEFKWHAAVHSGVVYARRCAGRDASGRQKFEMMHRRLVSGEWVALDATSMRAIGIAVGRHVQAAFSTLRLVQEEIQSEAVTTYAQIDAAPWPSNT